MDFYASPAMLGGIIACVAISAWTLGRWQRAAVPLGEACNPAPQALHAAASQHPPFEWRAADHADAARGLTGGRTSRSGPKVDLDCGLSLGELHAEVTAYRHQQRVFASVARDRLLIDQITAAAPPECDYPQSVEPWIGAQIPLLPEAEGYTYANLTVRTSPSKGAVRAAQPSPLCSALTRV